MIRCLVLVGLLSLPQLCLAGVVINVGGNHDKVVGLVLGDYEPLSTTFSWVVTPAENPVPGNAGTLEFTFVNLGILGTAEPSGGGYGESGQIIINELPLGDDQTIVFSVPVVVQASYYGFIDEDSLVGQIKNEVKAISGVWLDPETSDFTMAFLEESEFLVTVTIFGTITEGFVIVPEPSMLGPMTIGLAGVLFRRRF